MKTDFSLVAADIGGTKTTLALYQFHSWPGKPVLQETYQNRNADSFEQLLEQFIAKSSLTPIYASIGIAGIVLGDPVHMTNLNWTLSKKDLTYRFKFKKVFLINDLVATGMGAVILPPSDLVPLNSGTPIKETSISVLAPGTGLGEACVIEEEDGDLIALASEGGHVSFAPRTPLQVELLEYMMGKHEHVSAEHVCSGTGIPGLFEFMATKYEVSSKLKEEISQTTDKTPVIVHAALDSLKDGNTECAAYKTLSVFCEILADEAANLTLKTMSFGGLYLGGGLLLRILPFLDTNRFLEIFCRGRYANLLRDIPINIIKNSDTALLGAAAYGFNKLKKGHD